MVEEIKRETIAAGLFLVPAALCHRERYWRDKLRANFSTGLHPSCPTTLSVHAIITHPHHQPTWTAVSASECVRVNWWGWVFN